MDYSLLVGVHYLDRAKAVSPDHGPKAFKYPKGSGSSGTAHLVLDHSNNHQYEPALNAVEEEVHKTQDIDDVLSSALTSKGSKQRESQKELTPFDVHRNTKGDDKGDVLP